MACAQVLDSFFLFFEVQELGIILINKLSKPITNPNNAPKRLI